MTPEGRGRLRVVLAGILAVTLALAVHFGIVESGSREGTMIALLPFALIYGAGQLFLAIVFGRTLLAGREPLCTGFARLVHGTLRPDVERYTRAITAAWTAFFVTLLLASGALYLSGRFEAWSLLCNVLTPVLVAAMFLVEYFVRHRVLKDWDHVGFGTAIRVFARHVATRRGAEAQR